MSWFSVRMRPTDCRLVEVLVSYKNAKFVRGNDDSWSNEGYDACRADKTSASTNMEWCIRDRSQVSPLGNNSSGLTQPRWCVDGGELARWFLTDLVVGILVVVVLAVADVSSVMLLMLAPLQVQVVAIYRIDSWGGAAESNFDC
eukprot:SAG11_NODE_2281_length_3575_cov_2.137802_5_plen_144_part_00